VEAGQEHQRTKADVSVFVMLRGLQQRRHRARFHRAPDRARCAAPRFVVQVAERIDCASQLSVGQSQRRIRLGRDKAREKENAKDK
jgi:hypothetical protein